MTVVFMGRTIPQGIPLTGLGKARMITECKEANWGGWNVASCFGFEFRNVGQEGQKGAE
jgi:hypothetical protein